MRRRLVVAALAAATTLVVAFCVPLAYLVRDVARERAITAAERAAAQVAGALAATTDSVRLTSIVEATDAGTGRVGVTLPDGLTIGAEPAAAEVIDLARASSSPFEVETDAGVVWVEPVRVAGGVAVVGVVVPRSELRRGVHRAWITLAAVGAVLLVVGVAVAERFARSVTRPADALAAAAARVAAGDLGARVSPEGPPELARVAAGFNDLAGRVGALIAAERESVADLAHRLRTPIAAMRLDAEGVEDTARRSILLDDVDALERGVDTVIREARRPQRDATTPVSDVGNVTRERVEFWSALADDQARPWSVDVEPGHYPVTVPPSDLAAAIDAVLDNVFTHTPAGTAFSVTVAHVGSDRVHLVVRDRGPGFAERPVARGASGAGSTGLGLDIARRAAESGHGELRLGDDHGAVVVIDLPLRR